MAVDNFIPAIWSKSLLSRLHNSLVFAQDGVVNRNYEGEISGAGSTVKIHGIGAVSLLSYTKNADLTAAETLTDSEVILAVDQQKAFHFQIDDVDKAQQTPKIMNEAMQEAAYTLGSDLDGYIAAAAATAATVPTGFGSTGTPIAAYGGANPDIYDFMVDAFTALDEANAPSHDRFAVVPPWMHGRLRKDARFIGYGTQQNTAPRDNALIGEAAGFKVYVSNNVVNTAGAKHRPIFGQASAITVANQINSVEAYRPPLRFADAVKGLHVYGAKVVRPTCLISGWFTKA